MKLILVNSTQFRNLWSRILPSQRGGTEMPTPSIIFPHLDATVVLADAVTIGMLEDYPGSGPGGELTIAEFNDVVLHNTYKVIRPQG